MPLPHAELRARRQAAVHEHMESENRQEFNLTMATGENTGKLVLDMRS